MAEDTPIIHQTDAEAEEIGSDYYGNASTLPLRTETGSSSAVGGAGGGRRGQPGLAFLNELKQNLPEYQRSSHSSFMPQRSSGDSLPFDQKLDQFNYSTESSLYRPAPAVPQQPTPPDMRRPDSYYTAVRSSKAPTSHYRTPRPLAQPPAAPRRICHVRRLFIKRHRRIRRPRRQRHQRCHRLWPVPIPIIDPSRRRCSRRILIVRQGTEDWCHFVVVPIMYDFSSFYSHFEFPLVDFPFVLLCFCFPFWFH